MQHLAELRRRLLWAAGAVLIGAVVGWFLYEPAWQLLRVPITEVAKSHEANINFTNVTGAFDMRMQIAITIGLVASSPVWLFQLFAFFVPGLTSRERRYVLGFTFSAVPLFLLGCLSGWVVFPHIVELMATFVPEGSISLYDAKYYLDFVLKLVLVVGVAFELPVFLVLLNFIGVVSARGILRSWRWALLAIVIFTAIATPAADIASMFLLAVPMAVLYFAAVGVAEIHDRRAARRLALAEAESPESMIGSAS